MKLLRPLSLLLACTLLSLGTLFADAPSLAPAPSLATATRAAVAPAQPTEELLNLSDAKAAVKAYVEDGRYDRDLAAAATKAREWIEERSAARRPGERLAVVMDIDETVLSNLPVMRAEDFGYNTREWAAWIKKSEAPALPAVKEVFLAARAADVAVLFLTGRKDPRDRPGTEENLRREGMGDYAALQLTPNDRKKITSLERKTAARAAWAAEGWTIIATIGDQESDLGEHAERGFKLPNPFYKIP